ncbi:hypothetical protein MHU86_18754 [Fragilaria crotonensis]|nr:hypothetical protein MHU86_18754 [Fragilaria crotonensis]
MSVDPQTLKRYKSVLAAFMSFLHQRLPGDSYERDHVFTEAELTAVIPLDVCRYMRLKAYGSEFPSPDTNPIHSRHSAISFDKKAISFWMPNRDKWSVTRTEGNPTQSKDVLDLLKAVKKKEVRKQGANLRYSGSLERVGRVSDVYDDTELPYPDAKVGAVLCGGGPCIYKTNPAVDSAMMDSFVLSHVVPNARKRLPDSACLVLGKALMWMITSPFADDHIPVEFKDKVLSDWAHVCGGDSELDAEQSAIYKNPVQKLAVVVSGDFGAVFIDTIGELEEGGEGGGGGNRAFGMQGSHANFRNQLTGMQSCLLALRQENMEMKSSISGLKISMERNFGIVNGNVRRLAMRPTRNLTVLATAATNQQNQGEWQPSMQGRPCNDACDPHANAQESS